MNKSKSNKRTSKKINPKNDPVVTDRAPAKPKTTKRKTVKQKKPEEAMDRPTLIGIARLLKGAGSDVKALKSDTDIQLQRKINDAIQRLPPPEVIKQLEAIDPEKLVNGLKLDCIGIFIDLSDVSCVHCPDAKSCAEKFIGNIRGGFAHVGGAKSGAPEAKPATAPSSSRLTPVTRYEPGRAIFVRDVRNPNPKGDDLHDTINRVLDEQPETLGELRAIVEVDFDIEGNGDFMKFVTALRDPKEGVIKLDVDLTDRDKAALLSAGYDI